MWMRPCLFLILRCILVDRITSRQGRHILVYTWCFNLSFVHFQPLLSWFLQGEGLWLGKSMGFFRSFYLNRWNGLTKFTYERDWRWRKNTQSSSFCFCSDCCKAKCCESVLEIRNGERTLYLVHFFVFKPNLDLQPTKFKSRLASALPIMFTH